MNKEYLKNLHSFYGIEEDFDTWYENIKNDGAYKKNLFEDLKFNRKVKKDNRIPADASYINWNNTNFGAENFDSKNFWKTSKFNKDNYTVDTQQGIFTYTDPKTKLANVIDPVNYPEHADSIYALKQDTPILDQYEFTSYGGLVPKQKVKVVEQASELQPIPTEHITLNDLDLWKRPGVVKKTKNIIDIYNEFYAKDKVVFEKKRVGTTNSIIVKDEFGNEIELNPKDLNYKNRTKGKGESILNSADFFNQQVTQFVEESRNQWKDLREFQNDKVVERNHNNREYEKSKSLDNVSLLGEETNTERRTRKEILQQRCEQGDQKACEDLMDMKKDSNDDYNVSVDYGKYTINIDEQMDFLTDFEEEVEKRGLIPDTEEYNSFLNFWEAKNAKYITSIEKTTGSSVTDLKRQKELYDKAIDNILTGRVFGRGSKNLPSVGQTISPDWLTDKYQLLDGLSFAQIEELAGETFDGQTFAGAKTWDIQKQEAHLKNVQGRLYQVAMVNIMSEAKDIENELNNLTNNDRVILENEANYLNEEQYIIEQKQKTEWKPILDKINPILEEKTIKEKELNDLNGKINFMNERFKFMEENNMQPSSVMITDYNNSLEQSKSLYQDYQGFMDTHKDIFEEYAGISKEINDYVKLKEEHDGKIEKYNEKLDAVKERSTEIFGDENTPGQIDIIAQEYNFNVATKQFENNFALTTEYQQMLENNKIKGGLFGLLPGGKGFSQLAQEMARMAGEFYTGVPLFVVNTLSSVAGYNNFIGNDGAHYTRLDAVNDWFGKMSGYNLVGATPTSMYEGEGFRSYFRKGKGTSMIAEMLPFVFQVGYSMKNPGSWKGMYSKAYSMFTKKGGASVVDPKWAAKFRGVDKAWGVTVMDNYIMGLDYGLGDVEASIFAHSLSTATGFSQMILPDSRWLGGTVFTNAKDTFVNGLKKTATLKGVAKKQGYKNAFIGLMNNVFFEEVEELVEMGSQDVIKHAFGLGHTAEFRDWKTQQSTLAGVILLGGTSAPIQITNDYREGRNAIYKEFKKDTQKNITNIKEKIKDAEIELEKYKKKNNQNGINTYTEMIKQYKQGLQYAINLDQAINITPENITNNELELIAEKIGLINSKKDLDSSYHEEIDNKIKDINKRIEDTKMKEKIEEKKAKIKAGVDKYVTAIQKATGIKINIDEISDSEIENRINEKSKNEIAYFLDVAIPSINKEIKKIQRMLRQDPNSKKTITIEGKKYKLKEAEQLLKDYKKQVKEKIIPNLKKQGKGAKDQFGMFFTEINEKTGKREFNIILNATKSMVGSSAHELLHVILWRTLKDLSGPSVELRNNLSDALIQHVGQQNLSPRILSYGQLQEVVNPETGKKETVFVRDANFGEEVFTIMSESIIDKSLPYNDDLVAKIGTELRRFFRATFPGSRLGRLRWDNGQMLWNFIEDFARSIEDGVVDDAIVQIAVKGARGKLVDPSAAEVEKAQEEREKQEDAPFIDIAYSKDESKFDTSERVKIDELVLNTRTSAPGSPIGSRMDKDEWDRYGVAAAYQAMMDGKILDGLIVKGIEIDKNNPNVYGKPLDNFIEDVKADLIGTLMRFNPEINDSLSGWINNQINFRKGDVLKKYKKEVGTVSADVGFKTDTGEDLIRQVAALVDEDVTRFEEQDLTKKQIKTGPRKFLSTIKTKPKVKEKIKNIVSKTNIKLKDLNYKGVKKLVVGKEAPLAGILNEISDMFGVPSSKIIGNKDLDSKQREKAQKFIEENAQQLIDMLPEGITVSGKATGVAPTLLNPFYTKQERVKMAKTGSKQGLPAQVKNKNITPAYFNNVFGITPTGPNVNNKSVDGPIRALITQAATITANQNIREDAMSNSSNPFDVIALIGDGKSELMFSKDTPGSNVNKEFFNKQAADTLRNYGNAGYTNDIDYIDATVENIVEQTALNQNRNLPQGLRYQQDIKQAESTPSTIKNLITPNGVWIGPKLYDDTGNGYGTINQTQKDYVEQTMYVGSGFHPSIDSKKIQFLFGIKDSGSAIYEGETTYSTRSVNPKGHVEQMKRLDNRDQNLEKENKFCKDNNINPENFKYAQPMVFSGRVKEIIMDIKSQKGLKNKLKKLKEHIKEIQNINKGNKAVLKYFTLKLKEAYQNPVVDKKGKLLTPSDISLFHLGKLQTNVIEGIRSLSTLGWLYLTEETQVPNKYNPPTKKKGLSNKEYYESEEYSNYVSGWEGTVDYKTIFNKVKNNDKTKTRAKDLDISLDLATAIITIKKIKEKNEHVGASATTNREIASHVYSNGSAMSIDLVGDSHVSFFGPKFLMDDYLDAKIKDPKTGKMVDNKVSLEGVFRLTKFAGPRRKNIFHITADMDADGNIENDVSDYIVKTENLYDVYNNIFFSKDNPSNQISKKSINLSKAGISKPQGISVLDFDDTLATTESKVLFTAPDGVKGELNAEEYARDYETLSKEGYKFDFSQFEKVIGAKTAPLFNKALKLAGKFGTKDMFVLTARPAGSQKGIFEFLKSQGLNIPLKNITGLGNSTAEAKALWIADKVAEGYNDFYFADDSLANVEAVNNILEQFDVKRKVQQARIQFSKDGDARMNEILEEGAIDLDKDFNVIVGETKGVSPEMEFSAAKARIRGEKKGKFKFFIPPSAEDFAGLCYSFFGKGKQGEKHHKWFKDNLFDPYAKGVRGLNLVRQTISNDVTKLKQASPEVKKLLRKTIPNSEYTYEQAIRIYIWDTAGYDIPGISESDKKELIEKVENDHRLEKFANSLFNTVDGKIQYAAPDAFWLAGSISYDINESLQLAREQMLAQWVENKNIVFSEKNLNKIEATYGTPFREALEDILWRMENGTNRRYGNNKQVNNFMDWINGSIGTTMFVNIRSSVLQGLSQVNFINWHDNNPLKAAAAFANLPQFCKDFMLIFNSNWLKQRRSGLQHDVNAAEMIQSIRNSKNPVRAAIGYLLQKGFKPTQIMDSFAIASGGATFYRNRIKTYLKQGLTQKQAEDRAFIDLQEIAEETQQSSRPDRISMQQASVLGKLILAFQNTPMQYMRLTKKAGLDLINGRGDAKTNISKIIYYSTVQNFIFYSLQSALFALAFDDDEDEEAREDKLHKKKIFTINGMMDTALRGSGIAGAVVSTLKNMILKYMDQEKKRSPDHAYTLIEGLNLSPPIGIKARKLYGGLQTWEFNDEVIKHMSKTDIDNPLYSGLFSITEAITNVPLSRAYTKLGNIREALDSDNQTWQRVALFLGWNKWNLGIQDDKIMSIKQEISEIKKIKRKEEKLKQKYPGKTKSEIVRLEKGAEIYKYNKGEQVKTLLDLGLNKEEIGDLKKEEDRVNKILELHDNNPSKVDSVLSSNKGYVKPAAEIEKEKEKEVKKKKRISTEDKIYKLKKSQQVKTLSDLGLGKEEIKELKYEKDRVDKILELRKDNRNKVDSILSVSKDYKPEVKEKEVEETKENFIEDQKKEREKGVSESAIKCAAVKRSGERCGKVVKKAGAIYCTVHEQVEQSETGEKVRCKKIKSDYTRCKMLTKNKSGLCYYHD